MISRAALLSTAPVFLLSGIAGLLKVMATMLAMVGGLLCFLRKVCMATEAIAIKCVKTRNWPGEAARTPLEDSLGRGAIYR